MDAIFGLPPHGVVANDPLWPLYARCRGTGNACRQIRLGYAGGLHGADPSGETEKTGTVLREENDVQAPPRTFRREFKLEVVKRIEAGETSTIAALCAALQDAVHRIAARRF